MHNFVYVLMAVICFILGGVSTYFAATSYKKQNWWMFAYDIFLVVLNLVVMYLCLKVGIK